MSTHTSVRRRLGAAVCAALVLAVGLVTVAAAPKGGAKQREAEPAPASRLPNYYASVVTPEQRAKIAAVQEQFAPQIQQKRDELKALTDKRDAAMFKLLSPEQRTEVEQRRAAAKAKRQAALGDEGDEEMEDEAPAKPKASRAAKKDS